jgi:2-polyprenyl-3-methyl-5-hydroxy-6-metoxy-1,4-benzoquinol methylase
VEACLGVVVPCFNEAATVTSLLERVLASPVVREVVVVDDGSRDGTAELVEKMTDPRVRLVRQPENLGKGAALRRGFLEVDSEFVIVQDADLEYDPDEYPKLLAPLLADQADVVYGTRFASGAPHRVLYYWHSVGNRLLTTVSNMFSGLNLTDMETCYKVFRREVLETLDLQEDRFGIEPEITAKVARGRWRVYEVGISYSGRTYAEGKKIGWRDGVSALRAITRYSPLLEKINGHAVVRDDGPVQFSESDDELATTLDSLRSAVNYQDWIFSMFEDHLGQRVLEVGAGHGDFTEELLDSGREVTALDMSPRCCAVLRDRFAGRAGLDVVEGDAGALSPDRQYDSALLINVLEHIDDDIGVLSSLKDAIRPGGHLLVFVPAFDGLYSDFDRMIGHRRRYRRSHLVMAADAAGYEIVDAHYVNSVGALVWWLFARRFRQIPTSEGLVKLYDNVAVPPLRKIETRHTPRVGQSVLLVARRP